MDAIGSSTTALFGWKEVNRWAWSDITNYGVLGDVTISAPATLLTDPGDEQPDEPIIVGAGQ